MLIDKYKVNKDGSILNTKTNKFLKPQNNGNGYLKITLTINGIQHQKYIHRLVAEAYCDLKNGYNQVNHIDGNKSNNNYYNLEWVNNSLNQIHAHKIGLKKNGNELWNGKFEKEDILNIKELYRLGILQYKIASLYKVSKSTICEILKGKRYKYV